MTNDPNEWQGRGMEPTTIVDLVAGWTWRDFAIAAVVIIALNLILAYMPH